MATAQRRGVVVSEMKSNLTVDEMSLMRMTELREELERLGLATTGNKEELRNRLMAAISLSEQEAVGEVTQAEQSRDDGGGRHDDSAKDEEETINRTGYRRKNINDERVDAGPTLSFRDIEDSVDIFTGDDGKNVNKWMDDFEEVAYMCRWTDVQKIIYAKRLLRGSAKLFVSYEKCSGSWQTLKRALKLEFAPRVNSRLVHMELAQRKKLPSESFQKYFYIMMEISAQVDMEEESIIQYIIDGIPDDIVNKTILYGARDVQEFRSKLTIYENMKKSAKAKPKMVESKEKELSRFTRKDASSYCFNCGGKNHISKFCPDKEKGIKCFACGELGHRANFCTKSKDNSQPLCNHITIRQSSKIDEADENRSNEKPQCNIVIAGENEKPVKKVRIGDRNITALFDSGSDLSLIGATEYIKIGAPKFNSAGIDITGFSQNCTSSLGAFDSDITVDGETYPIQVHVVSSDFKGFELLLGVNFLKQVKVCLKKGEVVRVTGEKDETSEHIVGVSDTCKISSCDESSEIDLSPITSVKSIKVFEHMVKISQPSEKEKVGVQRDIALKEEVPVYQELKRLSSNERKENVDDLSRNSLPTVMLDEENREEPVPRFRRSQGKDEELKYIAENIEKKKNESYCVENDLLCKDVNDKLLSVVTEELQVDVIKEVHSVDHLGISKTESPLRRDCGSKEIHPKEERVVRNCVNSILPESEHRQQEINATYERRIQEGRRKEYKKVRKKDPSA